MTTRITRESEIVLETCCICGMVFGVAAEFHAQRRLDKKIFYCPNGHGQSYTESEADRLTRRVAELERQLARTTELSNERQATSDRLAHSLNGMRGQVGRLMKRLRTSNEKA